MPTITLAQKIEAQRNYFLKGLPQTTAHRISALKQLYNAVKKRQNDIIAALHTDMGKPPTEAYLGEISPVLHEISFAIKHLKRWQRPKRALTPLFLQPAKSRLYHEPYGVCLIIAPWNYPFSLCMTPLVSAIAAGNCVTVKPSRQTPATAALIRQILAELFSPEFIQVTQDDEQTAVLTQTYDFIFFTGGTATAKTVMQAAAQTLTPVALELGGKSPCIIDGDLRDLKTVAKRIMWGKFFNAGQTCLAPDYVLVPKERQSELISHFKTALTHMYGSKPPVTGENYTRIINAAQWQKLNNMLESERDNVAWGGSVDADGLYIEPTIFSDVDWQSPLMQHEIFGPLLPVIPYANLAKMLEKLTECPKPLALYVFSKNKRFCRTINHKLSFGGGCQNAVMLHYINPHLPFGGVGLSGMGRYHGKFGFETFSHVKPVLKKALWGEPNLQYPPYSKGKLKLIKKFM